MLEYVRGSNPASDIGRHISDSAAAATWADPAGVQNQLTTATAKGLNHATGHGQRGDWQATDSNPLVREVTERLHVVAVNRMAVMKENPPC